jgi:hypothetical protein
MNGIKDLLSGMFVIQDKYSELMQLRIATELILEVRHML